MKILTAGVLLAGLFFLLGVYYGRRSTQELRLEVQYPGAAEAISAAAQYPLDLNSASEEELARLPGIGEKRARDIVEYRIQNGPFSSVQDLLNIDGIGQKTLDSLLDYITVTKQ